MRVALLRLVQDVMENWFEFCTPMCITANSNEVQAIKHILEDELNQYQYRSGRKYQIAKK